MARAKLHLICGNCGCNDMWEYHIHPTGRDINGVICPAVFLKCCNCSTLHDLAETAEEVPPNMANN